MTRCVLVVILAVYAGFAFGRAEGAKLDVKTEMVGGLTWKYVIVDEGAELYGNLRAGENCVDPGWESRVIVPNELGGRPVVSVGEYAFGSCRLLQSIRLPPTVRKLGWGAFYYCQSLGDFDLPATVRSLGESCFHGCGFRSIDLPVAVTEIPKGAFASCTQLKYVTGGYCVTHIGESAFAGCSSLSRITLYSVVSIGLRAFADCGIIPEIAFPPTLKSIGEEVGHFSFCKFQGDVPSGFDSFIKEVASTRIIVSPRYYNRYSPYAIPGASPIYIGTKE